MRTLATALLILLVSPNLRAEGFGGTIESGYETTIEDRIWANVSSPASSGTLDSIKVFIVVTGSSHLVKLAVYQYSDTSFIDSTEVIDVSTGTASWVYFDFINNASITASTEYALAVVAEATSGDCKVEFSLSGGTHIGQSTFTYGVWPTPKWTTADQGGVYDLSVYAYYTAEAAAAGQVIVIQQ